MQTDSQKVLGVVPCAGFATRISPLPCSKEIYPVGWYRKDETGTERPRVIASYLLESMKSAGADEVLMIIRKGKWDIPDYFGMGQQDTPPMAYCVLNPTEGVPFTIDQCYPHIKDKRILFGFPDIYVRPENMFTRMIARQNQTKAEVVLGLFNARNPSKVDMVEREEDGRIRAIDIKPAATNLTQTWITAVWDGRFTEFLHGQVDGLNQQPGTQKGEIYLGDIIRLAMENGLHVNSVIFSDGQYLDIGTKADLKRLASVIEPGS